MERARIEADRAARGINGYGPPSISNAMMSPAPRIGEIMSPGVMHPAMMSGSTGSFPRPPIPHHAFTAGPAGGGPGARYPIGIGEQARRYSLQDNGPPPPVVPTGPGLMPGAGGRRGSRDERGEAASNQKELKIDQGPQTFAEMGFVSKPVEADSCVIM